jgi:hypothetical protein
VRLSDSAVWDRGKSVLRLRVTIESPDGTVASAFSNTFEAPWSADSLLYRRSLG